MNISLLTIVKNRKSAILNMISGLCNGTSLPAELVIVHMNEDKYGLSGLPFPVKEYTLSSIDLLPLAHARNFAVRKASFDTMIFLDADCIPSVNFIEAYDKILNEENILISGRVKYLTQAVMKAPDLLQVMSKVSIPDPVRGELDQYPYQLFWSLNFGCSKATYSKIGGFDEGFSGYGAEDTDFAFSANKNGVDFITIDAFAYHQYHPSYDPPINHIEPIVKNATRFKAKWGLWPMEGWLKKFCEMGYTRFINGQINLLKLPTPDEISAVLKHS